MSQRLVRLIKLKEQRESRYGPEEMFEDTQGRSWLRLACGVCVLTDQYIALLDAVAESDRLCQQGGGELGITEISRRCGIEKGRILEGLIREARWANQEAERGRKSPDQLQEEADKAFRAPSPSVYPSHRKANGHVFYPVPGQEFGTIGGVKIAPETA